MELYQLRTFLAVCRHGSLSAAGDELHLSQPAVTRQIQSLEKQVGVRLLDRQGRSVQPTPAGQTLLRFAEQIVQTILACETVMEDLRLGKRGRLSIGAGLTTTAFVLPALIQEYKRRLPAIELSIVTGTTQEILQHVLARRIDLGFVTSPVKHSDCITRALFQDEIILVGDPSQPLAGISIAVSELQSVPLVMYGPSGFRDFLEEELHIAKVEPTIVMELDSIEGIKRMAAAGVGHAFVPRSAAREELQEGKLVEVPVRGFGPLLRETSLLYLRDLTASLPIQGFMEIIDRHWPNRKK